MMMGAWIKLSEQKPPLGTTTWICVRRPDGTPATTGYFYWTAEADYDRMGWVKYWRPVTGGDIPLPPEVPAKGAD